MKLPSRLASLLRELRRRRVLQAAAVYATGAFVGVQVAALVFPALGIAPWLQTLVVVVAIAGFPVVVAFWWAFEVTPGGIRRTVEREEEAEVIHPRGTPWLALGLVAVVSAISAGLGWAAWDLWLAPESAGRTAGGGEAAPAAVSLPPTRVAVLPFDTRGGSADVARVAEGLRRDLFHQLNQIEDLDVVSDLGAQAYGNLALPPDSVARALGAGSLVTGTVEGVGDSIRLQMQLVDGRTGESLMSRQFTSLRGSVLRIRDELVAEAVRQLRIRLGDAVELERTRASTDDAQAWDLFYEAEKLVERADSLRFRGGSRLARDFYERADSLYQQARDADPSWLAPQLARGWLALKVARLGGPLIASADPEKLRDGVAIANRILAEEPGNAAAFELRGTLRSWLCQIRAVDSVEAVRERAASDLRAAVTRDRNRARAWAELAEVLRAQGKFDGARRAWDQAREVDAFLSSREDIPRLGSHLALEFGEIEKALEWARLGQRRYPGPGTYLQLQLLAYTYPRETGPTVSPDSVWTILRHFEEIMGGPQHYARIWVAAALARHGLDDSARSVLQRALAGTDEAYTRYTAYYEPKVWLNLGDTARALERLRDVVQVHDWPREYVAKDAYWLPLHGDSAFQALVGGRE